LLSQLLAQAADAAVAIKSAPRAGIAALMPMNVSEKPCGSRSTAISGAENGEGAAIAEPDLA
jgi:hypothetical protein